MDRGKKAAYNSLASAFSQIVTTICGFILPRLILSAYGSSYNGIIASITQFLSVVALLSAGVGAVSRAALYKYLANNNTDQISAIVNATEIFTRKVALIFLGIVVSFSFLYPYFVRDEFEWWFSALLVIIISIGTFIQYFFGFAYQMVFQADQRQYITAIFNIVSIVLNTIFAVVLINLGLGIHVVKLGSAVAFSITPLALNILAKKQYHLDRKIPPDFSLLSQRWDAFSHQLAVFIHNNTDIVLLTIFTNTKEISVYTVYYMVANGLKNIMNTLVVGVESAFGNILAKNEMDTLRKDVIHYETMLHVISSILFGAAIPLVTPFVQVYTRGINDVNYSRYLFGYLVIIGQLLFVLRSPYEALVNAAGHFKQTKKYAFLEASINLAISTILVIKYDLVGVIMGTVISIVYRTIVYGTYASRYIMQRSTSICIRRYLITIITMVSICTISVIIPKPRMISYADWTIYAMEITLVAISVTLFYNYLFCKSAMQDMIKKLSGIIKRMIKR